MSQDLPTDSQTNIPHSAVKHHHFLIHQNKVQDEPKTSYDRNICSANIDCESDISYDKDTCVIHPLEILKDTT